jgi:hypothetical protein
LSKGVNWISSVIECLVCAVIRFFLAWQTRQGSIVERVDVGVLSSQNNPFAEVRGFFILGTIVEMGEIGVYCIDELGVVVVW